MADGTGSNRRTGSLSGSFTPSANARVWRKTNATLTCAATASCCVATNRDPPCLRAWRRHGAHPQQVYACVAGDCRDDGPLPSRPTRQPMPPWWRGIGHQREAHACPNFDPRQDGGRSGRRHCRCPAPTSETTPRRRQPPARNGYRANISITAALTAACRSWRCLLVMRAIATPSQTSCLRLASTRWMRSVPSSYWSTQVS